MDASPEDINEANDALMMFDIEQNDNPTSKAPGQRRPPPPRRWDPTPPQSPAPSPANLDSSYTARPTQAANVDAVMAKLFLNDKYSDFTIVVGDRIYPAHKNIVCMQSAFFKACFRSRFREAQENSITITDEGPKDVYRLLHFFYLKDYLDHPSHFDKPHQNDDNHSGQFHYSTRVNFTMYRLADKYGVPGLARLAVDKHMERSYEVNLLTGFIWAAELCYPMFEGRHDAMRKIHVIQVADILWQADQGPEWLKYDPCIQAMCEKWAEFTFDLFKWQLFSKVHGHGAREMIWRQERNRLELHFGELGW